MTDRSRFWNAKERSMLDIQISCQDRPFPVWTRFIYDNTTNAMIQHNCTTSQADFQTPPCGSLYRGWIQGGHPSPEEGKYIVICFMILFAMLPNLPLYFSVVVISK